MRGAPYVKNVSSSVEATTGEMNLRKLCLTPEIDVNNLRRELKLVNDELIALKQRVKERSSASSIIEKRLALSPSKVIYSSAIDLQRVLDETKEINRDISIDSEAKASLIAKLEVEVSAAHVEIEVLKQTIKRNTSMIDELVVSREKLKNQLFDQGELHSTLADLSRPRSSDSSWI